MDEATIQKMIDDFAKSWPNITRLMADYQKTLKSQIDTAKKQKISDVDMLTHLKDINYYLLKNKKSYEELSAEIKDLTEKFKNGSISSEEFTNELKTLRDQVNQNMNQNQKQKLIEEKQAAEEMNLRNKVQENLKNTLGAVSGTALGGVAKTAFKVADAVLQGNDAYTQANALFTGAIDTVNSAFQAGSTGLKELGASTMGAGGRVGRLGIAASVTGEAIGFLSNQISTLAKSGIMLMINTTKEFINDIRGMREVGASFAGGFTEMQAVAKDATLTLDGFTKVVTANKDMFIAAGYGVGEGSKVAAKAMKKASTIVDSSGTSLSDQMLALGYNFEDQLALSTQVMALNRATGNQKRMSDTELAETTAQYAKDLKVLADITGKDAKKAMEDARIASMRSEIMAQLNTEEAKKFQAVYAAIPESQKKGFIEYVATGGKAIVDLATNIQLQQNQKLGVAYQSWLGSIKDSSVSVSEASHNAIKTSIEAGQEQRRLAKLGSPIGLVSTLLAGKLDGVATGMNDLIQVGGQSVDSVEKSIDATNLQAEQSKDLIRAQKAVQENAIKVQTAVTAHLSEFDVMLSTVIEDINRALDHLGPATIIGTIKDMMTMPFLIGIAGAVIPSILQAVMMKSMLGGAAKRGLLAGAETVAEGAVGAGLLKKLGPSLLKGAKIGGGLGLAGYGINLLGEQVTKSGHATAGSAISLIGQTGEWAGTGAAIGSIIPGVGTLAGGLIGGAAGLGKGIYDRWNTPEASTGGQSAPHATPKAGSNPVAETAKAQPDIIMLLKQQVDLLKQLVEEAKQTVTATNQVGDYARKQLHAVS